MHKRTELNTLSMARVELLGAVLDIDVQTEGMDLAPTVTLRMCGPDCAALDIVVERDDGAAFRLNKLKVEAKVPVLDIHRHKAAPAPAHCNQLSRASFNWWLRERAFASAGSPYIMGYSRSGRNRFFMGFVDQIGDTEVMTDTFHYKENDDDIETSRYILARPLGAAIVTDRYAETLYVSRADRNWERVIRDYIRFHDTELSFRTAYAPEAATEPVWCSWYAYRNENNSETTIANARIARGLGIRTVIIDGGWYQSPGRCNWDDNLGAWRPNAEKFPDLARTVRVIQGLGMKVLLWFGPFLLDDKTPEYKEYGYLRIVEGGMERREMCPMVRETGERIARVAEVLMRAYGLDGLKIDFVDSLKYPVCHGRHEHDFDTVSAGVDYCLRRLHETITAIKPDALIEFRQDYANIANRAYANCFRANDSPYDYDHIRREVALLRPYAVGIPVHADYAYWHPRESAENKARFMANLIYGCVPTLSMPLDKLPSDDLDLIRTWLAFFQRYKQTLLWGDLTTMSQDAHYSVSRLEGDGRVIYGLFSPTAPGILEGASAGSEIILINGTDRERIFTRIEGHIGPGRLTVLNRQHRPLREAAYGDNTDAVDLDFEVPVGGLVRFIPNPVQM